MKDIQKLIMFVLMFSTLTGSFASVLTVILGSQIAGFITSSGLVSTILLLLYKGWKYTIWKIPYISDILAFAIGFYKYPNLSGVWKIEYTSSFIMPDGKNATGTGFVTIEQDYEQLHFVDGQFKGSSKFESFFTGLKRKDNGRWFVVFAYENKGLEHEPVPPPLGGMHTGFCMLELNNKDTLVGYYATDKMRRTRGDITFKRKTR